MVNTLKSPTQKSKILPVWLMRLIGISSLATAVIGFAIYWFRKYPPRRKINSPREANNAGNTEVTVIKFPFRCLCAMTNDK
jgi:hypothetical protein